MYIFDTRKIIFKQTKICSFTFDSIISFVQSLKKKDFFSKGRIWNSREDRGSEEETLILERKNLELEGGSEESLKRIKDTSFGKEEFRIRKRIRRIVEMKERHSFLKGTNLKFEGGFKKWKRRRDTSFGKEESWK